MMTVRLRVAKTIFVASLMLTFVVAPAPPTIPGYTLLTANARHQLVGQVRSGYYNAPTTLHGVESTTPGMTLQDCATLCTNDALCQTVLFNPAEPRCVPLYYRQWQIAGEGSSMTSPNTRPPTGVIALERNADVVMPATFAVSRMAGGQCMFFYNAGIPAREQIVMHPVKDNEEAFSRCRDLCTASWPCRTYQMESGTRPGYPLPGEFATCTLYDNDVFGSGPLPAGHYAFSQSNGCGSLNRFWGFVGAPVSRRIPKARVTSPVTSTMPGGVVAIPSPVGTTIPALRALLPTTSRP